ncbi:MAG: ROK family protein [Candidatus Omnitrophica bacterium]|nr:ROK family protein [Candidatus Omnitrophota bacterium]
MAPHYCIAIDLGGTNLKTALLDPRYKILDRHLLFTGSFSRKADLIRAITRCVETVISRNKLRKKDIVGLGLGLPGPIDVEKKSVHFFPNIPGWKNVALGRILEQKFMVPVFLDNDAKLMALAEHRLGAARGFQHAVCITLGTGVGGGIIIGGRLYRGRDNASSEIGHIPINETGPLCNCGGRACLEAYIGNRRIMQEARRIFGRDIPLEEISRRARRGDRKARALWRAVGTRLGIMLVGVVNMLNPQVIVIGGGVAGAGAVLFERVREVVSAQAMAVQSRKLKIVRAKLGNDAGLIGAAVMVRERTQG